MPWTPPHLDLLVTGLVLGAVAALASTALPVRLRPWPVAAAPLLGLLAGPGLGSAVRSWDRPWVVTASVLGLAVGAAAAGGAAAAVPLGAVGTVASLAAVAAATVLAVPDTEGPVLATGALAGATAVVAAVEHRRPGTWPIADGPAALTAVAVAVVGLAGTTEGVVAAVGVGGTAAVLLATGPLVRHPRRPAVAPWLAAPVLGAAGAVVARLGAVRSTSPRALVVTVAAVALAWAGLEVGARLTSERARRRR